MYIAGDASTSQRISLKCDARLEGIGLSVVRSGLSELAYFCLARIDLSADVSALSTKFALAIAELRLDNQMRDAQLLAVVIRSSVLSGKRNLLEDEARQQQREPCVGLGFDIINSA